MRVHLWGWGWGGLLLDSKNMTRYSVIDMATASVGRQPVLLTELVYTQLWRIFPLAQTFGMLEAQRRVLYVPQVTVHFQALPSLT